MSQQINLLNPALRKQRDWLSAMPLAIACALVLAIFIAVYVTVRTQAERSEREADAVTAQQKAAQASLLATAKAISARKVNGQLAADLASARDQLQGRQAVMKILEAGAIGNTQGFSDYLRGFARQVPPGLWLTGFTIGTGGSELEIRGRMLDPATLPEYIRRLNAEPAFQGRSFAALDIRRPQQKPGAKSEAGSSPAYVDFVLRQSAQASAPTAPAAAEKMP